MFNEDPRKKLIVPGGMGVKLGPSKERMEQISNLEARTVCGGRDGFVWQEGPQKGKAVTGYCHVPLCIDTGECPAPRFVPHLQQSTELDEESKTNRARDIGGLEALEAVKEFHRRAVRRGARPERRTDQAIGKDIRKTWSNINRSMRGRGQWELGG